jgi:uncharacterized paraquat-inducible protein A
VGIAAAGNVKSMISQRPTTVRAATLNRLASGWQKSVGPLLVLLLPFFVYVLFVPILSTRVSFLSYNEIRLLAVAYDLFYTDKFLFVVVFGFGILAPACKMGFSIICWYVLSIGSAARWNARLSLMSKLSMLDVMLLAIFIIAIKGTGLGTVKISYGLYLYCTLVISSLLLNLAIDSMIRTRIPQQVRAPSNVRLHG